MSLPHFIRLSSWICSWKIVTFCGLVKHGYGFSIQFYHSFCLNFSELRLEKSYLFCFSLSNLFAYWTTTFWGKKKMRQFLVLLKKKLFHFTLQSLTIKVMVAVACTSQHQNLLSWHQHFHLWKKQRKKRKRGRRKLNWFVLYWWNSVQNIYLIWWIHLWNVYIGEVKQI